MRRRIAKGMRTRRLQLEEYRTVKFFDFTSARKMMTRIVQNVETGKVMVISKGADSAILSRCIPR